MTDISTGHHLSLLIHCRLLGRVGDLLFTNKTYLIDLTDKSDKCIPPLLEPVRM